jgi:hypothetical protein
MGKLEKKKVWTGFFIVPPVIILIAAGPSSVLTLMVLLATPRGIGISLILLRISARPESFPSIASWVPSQKASH